MISSLKTPKQLKNSDKQAPRSDTKAPSRRKQYTKEYLAYKEHLKSKEFKETRRIVIERDKCCQFCGRTEEELTLKNGKKLSWNVHHLPEGYKHLYDSPEVEAQYCRLYCSACHSAAHRAASNRTRFTMTFTDIQDYGTEGQ